ncbi:MAG: hypothetical protein HYU41_15975 [Candidatus Rokubacteria bacterium]|nr:hypothetical protein [Candidatus Rokubacteria bacterium]
MSNVHSALGVLAVVFLVVTPAVSRAANDCDALPRSALKTRTCNPQAECLAKVPRDVKGPAREARQRECSRLPTSGVCHGPDRYDPQAECRERRK